MARKARNSHRSLDKPEDALRDRLSVLEELLGAVHAVLWIRDMKEERLLYVSPAFERIFGRSVQALLHSPRIWLDSIHPEDRPHAMNAALKHARVGEDHMEYRVVRPDGTVRRVYDRSFPVRNRQGEIYRLAGIAEDVTDKR